MKLTKAKKKSRQSFISKREFVSSLENTIKSERVAGTLYTMAGVASLTASYFISPEANEYVSSVIQDVSKLKEFVDYAPKLVMPIISTAGGIAFFKAAYTSFAKIKPLKTKLQQIKSSSNSQNLTEDAYKK